MTVVVIEDSRKVSVTVVIVVVDEVATTAIAVRNR